MKKWFVLVVVIAIFALTFLVLEKLEERDMRKHIRNDLSATCVYCHVYHDGGK